MMKIALGLLLALGVGIVCRLAGLPLPAPLALTGALLVLAMTAGYETVDRLAAHREAKHRRNCGGPDGLLARHAPSGPTLRPEA
jgi:XapX domain-containing protein